MIKTFSDASIDAKKYFCNPEYLDLNRAVTHMRLAEMSKQRIEVDQKIMDRIHDGLLMRLMATDYEKGEEYRLKKLALENEVWPKLRAKMQNNPGMAQFMMEFGVWSDFIAQFLVNVWECPAKAVLPAHGVAEDLLRRPFAIPRTDPMYPFCYDQSYRMIQYRTAVPQADLRNAGDIIFLGGGLVPELWTNGYPLGEIDQRIVVYDVDADLPAYLERILGASLSSFGIDYRIGNYEEAFADMAQQGAYDYCVMNGVMSYVLDKVDYELAGIAGLLKTGAKACFDVQLSHFVLLFDVLTLAWPAEMETIKGYDAAVKMIRDPAEKAGFGEVNFTTEPYDASMGEAPAGMITVARKMI